MGTDSLLRLLQGALAPHLDHWIEWSDDYRARRLRDGATHVSSPREDRVFLIGTDRVCRYVTPSEALAAIAGGPVDARFARAGEAAEERWD